MHEGHIQNQGPEGKSGGANNNNTMLQESWLNLHVVNRTRVWRSRLLNGGPREYVYNECTARELVCKCTFIDRYKEKGAIGRL